MDFGPVVKPFGSTLKKASKKVAETSENELSLLDRPDEGIEKRSRNTGKDINLSFRL